MARVVCWFILRIAWMNASVRIKHTIPTPTSSAGRFASSSTIGASRLVRTIIGPASTRQGLPTPRFSGEVARPRDTRLGRDGAGAIAGILAKLGYTTCLASTIAMPVPALTLLTCIKRYILELAPVAGG